MRFSFVRVLLAPTASSPTRPCLGSWLRWARRPPKRDGAPRSRAARGTSRSSSAELTRLDLDDRERDVVRQLPALEPHDDGRARLGASAVTASPSSLLAIGCSRQRSRGLQRKGYTLDQIVASFRGDGLDLSTATMKSYLSRAKASRSRRRGAPKQTPVLTKGEAPLTEREAPPSTKLGTAPLTRRETPPSTKGETPALTEKETPPSMKDAPAKSGKDAFLLEDKPSY